jgi:hypothetical protein
MSLDFTEITHELFARIKTENFNKNNVKHMKALEDVLSEHIDDDELLFHILLSYKHSMPSDFDKKL